MGIGKDGKLPWKLPTDLKFFKEVTVTTSDPGKKNAVVMGRKTWDSIPLKYRPLPGRLNVVLTRSDSFDIARAENVVICRSMASALELLAEPPYSLSIEKIFVIGGGQIFRETLNAPGCEAIHITEIQTSIECDTFMPPVDSSVFQLWYSSFPKVENNIRYSFTTYVRVRRSVEHATQNADPVLDNNSDTLKFEFKDFSFLPKMILERHEEYKYLRLVEEIISEGTAKDDRTRTGTLSKFGCQMRFNLRRNFHLLTTKISGVLKSASVKRWSLVVSRSLSCLPYLEIENCGSLKSLKTQWMASPQLEDLGLLGCPEIDLFATEDPHRSLRSLTISYCEKLLSCAALQFHGVTHLCIEGENESVKSLPKEGWLPATLESLKLIGITSVKMLECKGLAHLTSLQQLSINYCYNLENIDGEKLPASLVRLIIDGSPLLGKWCEMKDPQVWPKISHIPAIQVGGRWIW